MAKYKKNQLIEIGLLNRMERVRGHVFKWEKTEKGNLRVTVKKEQEGPPAYALFMGARKDLYIEVIE
jgi:hypothetical protein